MPLKPLSKKSSVKKIKKHGSRAKITPNQGSGKPKYHYGKKKHR